MGLLSFVRPLARFLPGHQPPPASSQEDADAPPDHVRDAERCYVNQRWAQAVPHYAALLKEAQRRRYSTEKKMELLLRLAECLRRSDDLDGAENVARQAADFVRKGALHLAARYELTLLVHARGDHAAALEQARSIYQETRAAGSHPEVLATRCAQLAEWEAAAGNETTALELRREALLIVEDGLGSHHPATATQLSALAAALQQAGNLDEAVPLFERAHELHHARLGATSREALFDLEHLAQIRYLQHDVDVSTELYMKLSRLLENTLGLNHLQHATVLLDAATAHQAAGQTGRAVEFLYTARQKAGRDKTLGPLIEERLSQLSLLQE